MALDGTIEMKRKMLIDDITQCTYEINGTEFKIIDSWLADFKYVSLEWIMFWLSESYDVSSVGVVYK